MQCARAFAIFTRIDFPPFPVFYRPRGKEGVDCEQSEQDGAVQYNHTLPVAARHPSDNHPQNFAILRVISAGIQLAPRANLCHSALLRKFCGTQNWIPRARGMTTLGLG